MAKDKINIPDFARVLLKQQSCKFCMNGYSEDEVCAAGIRRHPTNGLLYFSYEVECSVCDNPAIAYVTSRPHDMYDLGVTIVEMFSIMNERGETDKKNIWELFPEILITSSKSLISDKEVEQLKSLLNNSSSHFDFLSKLGIRVEDISQLPDPKGSGLEE